MFTKKINYKHLLGRYNDVTNLFNDVTEENHMLRQELDWMQEQQEIWEQTADQLISVVDEMWERFIYDPNVKRQDLAALVRRADTAYKNAARTTDFMRATEFAVGV